MRLGGLAVKVARVGRFLRLAGGVVLCLGLGFALPGALLLMPLAGGDAFLAAWRYVTIGGAVAILAAGAAALRWNRAVRASQALRAVAGAVMGAAALVAAGTVAVTLLLAPPSSVATKKATPVAKAGGAGAKAAPGGGTGGPKGDSGGGAAGAAAAASAVPAGERRMPPPKPPEEMPAGEKLVREKCLGCHRFQGYGFGATDDLDKAAETHTMSWFMQLLRDPVNVGKKRMPKMALTDQEIVAISSYIAGRGGSKGQQQEWFGNKQIDLALVDLEAAGKKAFADLNCYGCHKLDGMGGDMGPDLSKEGQKRDAAWIEAFLSDYFTRGSAMPFLAISQDEIKALAAYLSSLK